MNDFISGAWREWLETQTRQQLEQSLGERERLVMTQESGTDEHSHTLREIDMIKTEFKRRDEAERTRAQFFPRVKFRDRADALFVGHLVHAHAVEVLERAQQVMAFKKMQMLGFSVSVQFTDQITGRESDDIDEVMDDLINRAMQTADLLGEIQTEVIRLYKEDGVTLSREEISTFEGIAAKLAEMQKGEQK